jgi:hypothetical protein
MIRQDNVVEMLFLNWWYDLVAKHLPNAQATGPDPQNCSNQGKLAGVFCRESPASGLLSL